MPKALRRPSTAIISVCAILASVALLWAVNLFGQEVPGGDALRGPFTLMIAALIVAYIYFAIALQAIAKKTRAENTWWAWVPILQIVLSLKIARKPVWWIVLCIIPVVNVVILTFIWMGVAKAVGKPSWLGILFIVPVMGPVIAGYLTRVPAMLLLACTALGLAVPGYLAWSANDGRSVDDPVAKA
jgi:hypothetical protein